MNEFSLVFTKTIHRIIKKAHQREHSCIRACKSSSKKITLVRQSGLISLWDRTWVCTKGEANSVAGDNFSLAPSRLCSDLNISWTSVSENRKFELPNNFIGCCYDRNKICEQTWEIFNCIYSYEAPSRWLILMMIIYKFIHWFCESKLFVAWS